MRFHIESVAVSKALFPISSALLAFPQVSIIHLERESSDEHGGQKDIIPSEEAAMYCQICKLDSILLFAHLKRVFAI